MAVLSLTNFHHVGFLWKVCSIICLICGISFSLRSFKCPLTFTISVFLKFLVEIPRVKPLQSHLCFSPSAHAYILMSTINGNLSFEDFIQNSFKTTLSTYHKINNIVQRRGILILIEVHHIVGTSRARIS